MKVILLFIPCLLLSCSGTNVIESDNVMFEDAAKYQGVDNIKIKDVAELLKESVLPVKNSNFEKLANDNKEDVAPDGADDNEGASQV